MATEKNLTPEQEEAKKWLDENEVPFADPEVSPTDEAFKEWAQRPAEDPPTNKPSLKKPNLKEIEIQKPSLKKPDLKKKDDSEPASYDIPFQLTGTTVSPLSSIDGGYSSDLDSPQAKKLEQRYEELQADIDKEAKWYKDRSRAIGRFEELPEEPKYITPSNRHTLLKELTPAYLDLQERKFLDMLPEEEREQYKGYVDAIKENEDYGDGKDGEWAQRVLGHLRNFLSPMGSYAFYNPNEAMVREQRREAAVKAVDEFVNTSVTKLSESNMKEHALILEKIEEVKADDTLTPEQKAMFQSGLVERGVEIEEDLRSMETISNALYALNNQVSMGAVESGVKSFSNVVTSLPRQGASLVKGIAAISGDKMDMYQAEQLYQTLSKLSENLMFKTDDSHGLANEIGNLIGVVTTNGALTAIGGNPAGVLYMMGLTHDEMYADLRAQNEARGLGLTDREMANAASLYAPIATGLFYASGIQQSIARATRKEFGSKFIDFALKNKGALRGVRNAETIAAQKKVQQWLLNAHEHGLTLSMAMTGGQAYNMGIKSLMNEKLDEGKFIEMAANNDVAKHLQETLISSYTIGFATGGLTGFFKLPPRERKYSYTQVEKILKDTDQVSRLKDTLTKRRDSKAITEKQYRETVEAINEDVKAISEVKEGLNDNQREAAAQIIHEINRLEKETYGKKGVEAEKQKIKELNEELNQIGEKPKEELKESLEDPLEEVNKAEEFNAALEKVRKEEPINEKEIEKAIDEGYEALDKLEKNEKISKADKESVSKIIEEDIAKLESYEKRTETTVREVKATEKVRGIREGKREQKKSPQERILSRKVRRIEGDKFFETVEDIPDTQKGKTKKPTKGAREEVTVLERGEDGKLYIQEFDKKGNRTTRQELSTDNINDFELVETIKDADGNVTGAILRNKKNAGEAFAIDDVEIAYDLAEQKTRAELGYITEKELDRAFSEIEYVETPVKGSTAKETVKPETPKKTETKEVKAERTEKVESEKKSRQEEIDRAPKLYEEAKKKMKEDRSLVRFIDKTRKKITPQNILGAMVWIKNKKFKDAFREDAVSYNANNVETLLKIDPKDISDPKILKEYNTALESYVKGGTPRITKELLNEVANINALKFGAETNMKLKPNIALGDVMIRKGMGNQAHNINQFLKGATWKEKLKFISESGLVDFWKDMTRKKLHLSKVEPKKESLVDSVDKIIKKQSKGLKQKAKNLLSMDTKRQEVGTYAGAMAYVLTPSPKMVKNIRGWVNQQVGFMKKSLAEESNIANQYPSNSRQWKQATARIKSLKRAIKDLSAIRDRLDKYTPEQLNKPIDKKHPLFKEWMNEMKGKEELSVIEAAWDLWRSQSETSLNHMDMTGRAYNRNPFHVSKRVGFTEKQPSNKKKADDVKIKKSEKGKDKPIEPTEAGGLKELREGMKDNQYYDFSDWIGHQIRQYDQNAKEAYTYASVNYLNGFLNGIKENSVDILGIRDPQRVAKLRTELNKSLNLENIANDFAVRIDSRTASGKAYQKTLRVLRNNMIRFLWGGAQVAGQSAQAIYPMIMYPKQVLSIAKTLANKDSNEAKALLEFQANYADAALRDQASLLNAGFFGKEDRVSKIGSKISLGDPDFRAANVNWAAAYKARAEKNLKKGEKFSWEEQLYKPDKEALSEAYMSTSLSQGSSMHEFTADFIKDPNEIVKALRMTATPYSSFLAQMKSSFISDITQMKYDPQAKKRIAAYASTVLGYTLMKQLYERTIGDAMYDLAADAITSDVEGGDRIAKALKVLRRNQRDSMTKKMSTQAVKDVGLFMLPPVAGLEDIALAGINDAIYWSANAMMGNMFDNQEEFEAQDMFQFPEFSQKEKDYFYLFPELKIIEETLKINDVIKEGRFTYVDPKTGRENYQKISEKDEVYLEAIRDMYLMSVILADQTFRKNTRDLYRNYKKQKSGTYYEERIRQGKFDDTDLDMLINSMSQTAESGNLPNPPRLERMIQEGMTVGKMEKVEDRLLHQAVMDLQKRMEKRNLGANDIEKIKELLGKMQRVRNYKFKTEGGEEKKSKERKKSEKMDG